MTSCTLTGLVGGDVASCTGTAAFDTASVGAGKTVTVSGLSLTGADAGNYALASTTATTTADDHGGDADAGGDGGEQDVRRDDERDGDELHADGVLGGDVVTCTGTAAFDTASVGAGKTVTVSGLSADGRGRGELRAGEHDGDDDRGDHRR